MSKLSPVVVNDRTYAAPKTCAIAICLDGCEPAYLEEAIAAGLMPNLKRIKETGTDRLAHSVVPSFTNPNNLSIATGRPPAVHGICGNYLYDPETKTEVMMNDVRFLRAPNARAAGRPKKVKHCALPRSVHIKPVRFHRPRWRPQKPPSAHKHSPTMSKYRLAGSIDPSLFQFRPRPTDLQAPEDQYGRRVTCCGPRMACRPPRSAAQRERAAPGRRPRIRQGRARARAQADLQGTHVSGGPHINQSTARPAARTRPGRRPHGTRGTPCRPRRKTQSALC